MLPNRAFMKRRYYPRGTSNAASAQSDVNSEESHWQQDLHMLFGAIVSVEHCDRGFSTSTEERERIQDCGRCDIDRPAILFVDKPFRVLTQVDEGSVSHCTVSAVVFRIATATKKLSFQVNVIKCSHGDSPHSTSKGLLGQGRKDGYSGRQERTRSRKPHCGGANDEAKCLMPSSVP